MHNAQCLLHDAQSSLHTAQCPLHPSQGPFGLYQRSAVFEVCGVARMFLSLRPERDAPRREQSPLA